MNFTATTLTNQLQDPVEDLGVRIVLASGAARRRGALSQVRPLWLSPIATRGHPHQSTNLSTNSISHQPRT